jgi:hypothetical protein
MLQKREQFLLLASTCHVARGSQDIYDRWSFFVMLEIDIP